MNYAIYWSPTAVRSFRKTMEFLSHQWSRKEQKKFASLTLKTVAILAKYPRSFPSSGHLNFRKALVHPHIALFYSVDEKNERIQLELFWDNRMDPAKLK